MSWFEVLQFAALTVVAVVAAMAGGMCGIEETDWNTKTKNRKEEKA